jgi:hypothetical protein
MAWIATIDRAAATGELREVYDQLAARPIPAPYRPPHGGSPGIHRAHSLDARLLFAVFRTTGSLHGGDGLSWSERELVAATSARTAGCFY